VQSDVPAAPAHDHLQRVQSLTDAALAHMTLEGLLGELLNRVRDLLTADTAAILLLDEDRRELIATAAKGIEEEVEQGVRIPVGSGFAGTIAATRRPVVLDSVDHTKVLNPLLLRRGIRSLLGVPLIVAGSVIGVLHVGTLHPRLFTGQDVELLQLVGDRAALALDARRHEQNGLIAQTLQRSLLPDRFPRTDGVEVSGLYVPAGGGMVGGDWYDVFALPSGALCVIVGDTVGSGLTAAIAMARLRDAVRALLFVEAAPSRTMTHLNAMMMHFDPKVIATLFVGLLDAEGSMRYSSAGHVPPIVVNHSMEARLVEDEPEPALGTAPFTYTDRHISLPEGSSLIVYTDGLVERRGRRIEDGIESLRRAAERRWSSVEELCARAVGAELFPSGLADDVAVVVVRFTYAATQTLQVTLAADPREIAGVRRKMRRWFAEYGISPEDVADVLLATGEAIANSVEHAYGPGRGSVRLHASLTDRTIDVTVADDGNWREPRGTDRGRGRALMRAAMDDVEFHSDDSGTTVHMRKVLSHREL